MELINNTTKTLKDDLAVEIKPGSKLSIAVACFSMKIQKGLDRLTKAARNEKQPKKKFELVQRAKVLKNRLERLE